MTLSVLDATSTKQQLSTFTNPKDSGLGTAHAVTDPLTGNQQTVNIQGQASVTSDGVKATYRYTGTFTPAATPSDMIVIQGSPTRTGRIKSIVLGGISTSGGNLLVTILRRSAANTGGTSSAVNAGKHDTTDPSATLAVVTYSANPSVLGAGAGNIGQKRLWLPSASQTPAPMVWDFATRQDKALILRGTSDFVVINGNGATVPTGGAIDFEIEIEEDGS